MTRRSCGRRRGGWWGCGRGWELRFHAKARSRHEGWRAGELMRAMVLGAVGGALRLAELPGPGVGPGEVLVRVTTVRASVRTCARTHGSPGTRSRVDMRSLSRPMRGPASRSLRGCAMCERRRAGAGLCQILRRGVGGRFG